MLARTGPPRFTSRQQSGERRSAGAIATSAVTFAPANADGAQIGAYVRVPWAGLLTSFATETTDELVTAFRIVDERRARLLALRARDVDDWRWLARRRAVVNRYSTRPAYHARLRDESDTVPAGLTARQDLGPTAGSDVFDAYVDHTAAERLVERYPLRPDAGGNVTLRTINLTDPRQLAAIREPLPEAVIAVDLCEDRDPRTAAAGRNLLTAMIRRAQVAGR